ncbi:MAG TPA: citrate synthase/methylcitrate synthase [Gemmatimonadaceae bacterium]|nr:citrate synthase/methylcitrate synthase [Gemmatimonadaceae bacterium]
MTTGLEGIVAASTRLSRVDGDAGTLVLVGYAVEDLAPHATFEEVVRLFVNRDLPSNQRSIPPETLELLRAAAARRASPMDALLMATPTLRVDRPEAVIAAFPTVVGTYWRLLHGENPVPVRQDLSHAAHYLHQLSGEVPSPQRTRALETYLNTVCDHGLNASTFTARIIASTHSDVIAAVTGALGALKGPLHGGAPGPALDMVFEIGTPDRAESVIRAKLDAGERLMGFGHRVYRVRDPRADVLAEAAERLYANGADRRIYDLARSVERTALRLLHEHKPDRHLDTNVEFYTALLLHGLGLPTDLFTPTFAVGRVLGWCAHYVEQLRDGRLIRPQSEYIGPVGLRYAA